MCIYILTHLFGTLQCQGEGRGTRCNVVSDRLFAVTTHARVPIVFTSKANTDAAAVLKWWETQNKIISRYEKIQI